MALQCYMDVIIKQSQYILVTYCMPTNILPQAIGVFLNSLAFDQ